jgi:3-oxocholest-4-en-26-oate---CoA ligase
MSNWNYADAFETIAAATPNAPAQDCGNRRYTWAEFEGRADRLAAHMLAHGVTRNAKVAAYLWNGPEYLETYLAAFKAGLAPVNTNYRYGANEIRYLFENADAEVVVFHAGFADLLEQVRQHLPLVKVWYVVDDAPEAGSSSARPSWAVPYEDVVATDTPTQHTHAPWGRSGDDLLLLYTGGTTGMPKGVMWRQDDLFNVLGSGGNPLFNAAPVSSVAELGERLIDPKHIIVRQLPACPLMHGTGQFSAMLALTLGGSVVTVPGRTFVPSDLLDTVERERINAIVIVGDAFARPILAALDASEGKRDLSSLRLVTSSGVMWSHEVKEGLLRHVPDAILFDSFGSSEAVGLGASVSTKEKTQKTAQFALGPTVHVFTDDNVRVDPGSELTGFVAISGYVPMGYYKDEEKSAKTFRTIDGVRYSVPGDYAQVNADGTLHLLGRGSVCINTGGEKVFPEEVEEVLKQHVAVRDAVCVGLPDERFGEVICALVEPSGDGAVVETDIIEHVRANLARYKAPRRVIEIATIGRSPAGKVDYKHLKQLAQEHVGSTA